MVPWRHCISGPRHPNNAEYWTVSWHIGIRIELTHILSKDWESPINGAFRRIPSAYALKGLTIHTLWRFGIPFVGSDLNVVQRTIVLLSVMVLARHNGAADGFVALFSLHVCPSLPRLRHK